MRIDAVSVTSSNLKKTVAFYELLGFKFGKFKEDEDHLEPETQAGSARLMIDSKKLIKDLLGEDPKPGNHSSFAIQYSSPKEVDSAADQVRDAGHKIVTEPWDAFWGQRYAVVQDPDGYRVDLYANL